MANPHDLRELEKDPRLFLYTSLTAGSSHIITATSRLETILKANKIPFQAIDIATDEQHRKLWQRRAGSRKLPGLVKEGFVVGDLEEIEEWNEYGELKENIGPVPGAATPGAVPAPKLPIIPTATAGTTEVTTKPVIDTSKMVALPGAAEIKARNNPLPISSPEDAAHPEKMTSAPAEKEKSIERSIKFKGDIEKHAEHLSVPASELPSMAATPEPAGDKKEKSDTAATATSAAEDKASGAGPAKGAAIEATQIDPVASTVAVETGEIDEPGSTVTNTAAVPEEIAAKATEIDEPKAATTNTAATQTSIPEHAPAIAEKSDEALSGTSEAQPTVSATAATQSPIDEAEKKVESLKITSDGSETQKQTAADPSAATESVQD